MKKVMALALSVLMFIIGCGSQENPVSAPQKPDAQQNSTEQKNQDDQNLIQDQNISTAIIEASVSTGQKIPSDTIIEIKSVPQLAMLEELLITVSDAEGVLSKIKSEGINQIIYWRPSSPMAVGSHILTIIGKDVLGKDIRFDPVNFIVVPTNPPLPLIIEATMREGMFAAQNTSMVFTFLNTMQSIEVKVLTIDGLAEKGEIIFDFTRKVAVWCPLKNLLVGAHTYEVSGIDFFGQSIEKFGPINFKVVGVDNTPPTLMGNNCVPKNGSQDVDPLDCKEIIIAFSERLSSCEKIVTEPDIQLGDTRMLEGDIVLTIPLKNSLPAKTTIKFKILAVDEAGNKAELSYMFSTK